VTKNAEKDKNIRGIFVGKLFKIIAAASCREMYSATFGAVRFSKSVNINVPH